MSHIWGRGECLALARHGCAYCMGLGQRLSKPGVPCNCVLRAVFRACYGRFCRSLSKEVRHAQVAWGDSMAQGPTGGPKKVWGYLEQEFAADFTQIAKRTLGEDSLAYKVFRFHYLLGADQPLCSRKLGLERGDFYHEVYRVQQRLGKAYRETKPYALFPTDEYFCRVVCGAKKADPTSPLSPDESRAKAPLELSPTTGEFCNSGQSLAGAEVAACRTASTCDGYGARRPGRPLRPPVLKSA